MRNEPETGAPPLQGLRVIDADPTVVNVRGPHGIPLVNHAEIGGNADVVALIQSKL